MSKRASIAFHTVRASYYIRRLGVAGLARFGWDYARNFAGPRGRRLRVRSPRNGELTIRARTSDYNVYFETFYMEQSDVSGFAQSADLRRKYEDMLARGVTPVVIDGGGNIGTVSTYLSRSFPKATIVLVEPDERNLEIARLNTEGLGNVTLRRAALWSSCETLRLSGGADEADANAITVSAAPGADDADCVAATTIDNILAEIAGGELLLLKIDIEGAESEAISGDAAWVTNRPVCIVEPHDWMIPGHASLQKLLSIPAFRNGDILVSGENLVFFPAR